MIRKYLIVGMSAAVVGLSACGSSSPPPEQVPGSASSAPSVISGSPSAAGYASCARRYGELVKDLTLAGGMTPEDKQRWGARAQAAATAAKSGDLPEAYQLCEKTVGEMEQVLGQ